MILKYSIVSKHNIKMFSEDFTNIINHLKENKRGTSLPFILYLVVFILGFLFSYSIADNIISLIKLKDMELVFSSIDGSFWLSIKVSLIFFLLITLPFLMYGLLFYSNLQQKLGDIHCQVYSGYCTCRICCRSNGLYTFTAYLYTAQCLNTRRTVGIFWSP